MIRSTPSTVSSVVALVLLSATSPAAAQNDPPKSNGTQRGLGLMISDEENQIVVRAIRPDSIAAKLNAIEVGARLTALKTGDKKTSLVGKSSRDVRDIIRGASYDEPEITIWFVPQDGESEAEVTLRRSIADIDSDRNLYRLEIDVPTSIEQVSLNQETHSSWTDDVFKRFLDIAETKEIPAGSELKVITRYGGIRGFYVTVWWVDLRIPTGQDSTNGFRIRDRKIASRAMTDDEKASLERFNAKIRERHPSLFKK